MHVTHASTLPRVRVRVQCNCLPTFQDQASIFASGVAQSYATGVTKPVVVLDLRVATAIVRRESIVCFIAISASQVLVTVDMQYVLKFCLNLRVKLFVHLRCI